MFFSTWFLTWSIFDVKSDQYICVCMNTYICSAHMYTYIYGCVCKKDAYIICDLCIVYHIELYIVRWECMKVHSFKNGSKLIIIHSWVVEKGKNYIIVYFFLLLFSHVSACKWNILCNMLFIWLCLFVELIDLFVLFFCFHMPQINLCSFIHSF